MKHQWLAIIGSPRQGGNTDNLVDCAVQGLQNQGIHVDKNYLRIDNFSSRLACEACILDGICIIHDETTEIMRKMNDYQGYIITSPSFNYNVTAPMKAFLDRTFCLNDYTTGWKSRLNDKKAIIIGVCKGQTQEAMGFAMDAMKNLSRNWASGLSNESNITAQKQTRFCEYII